MVLLLRVEVVYEAAAAVVHVAVSVVVAAHIALVHAVAANVRFGQ